MEIVPPLQMENACLMLHDVGQKLIDDDAQRLHLLGTESKIIKLLLKLAMLPSGARRNLAIEQSICSDPPGQTTRNSSSYAPEPGSIVLTILRHGRHCMRQSRNYGPCSASADNQGRTCR
jgi:hypothetical protein